MSLVLGTATPGGAATALPFAGFKMGHPGPLIHARQRSAVQKTDVPLCEISGLRRGPT